MSAEVVHRLGTAVCVAAGVWALAHAVSTARRGRRVRGRLEALVTVLAGGRGTGEREPGPEPAGRGPTGRGPTGRGPTGRGPTGRGPTGRRPAAGGAGRGRESLARGPRMRDAVRRWLPVAGALSACGVFVGGAAGVVVGLVAAFGTWWWQRRPVPVAEFDAGRAARQLPLAADLLAACIAAGASPVLAARAVGEALDGPVGERLARGAAEVRLGGEPAEAWRGLAALPGALALARLLERAGESGVPAAAPVARLAAEARTERERAATARARRAGVLITAPVGLCFLPAFIAIGVLPVVLGLASGVLGGGDG